MVQKTSQSMDKNTYGLIDNTDDRRRRREEKKRIMNRTHDERKMPENLGMLGDRKTREKESVARRHREKSNEFKKPFDRMPDAGMGYMKPVNIHKDRKFHEGTYGGRKLAERFIGIHTSNRIDADATAPVGNTSLDSNEEQMTEVRQPVSSKSHSNTQVEKSVDSSGSGDYKVVAEITQKPSEPNMEEKAVMPSPSVSGQDVSDSRADGNTNQKGAHGDDMPSQSATDSDGQQSNDTTEKVAEAKKSDVSINKSQSFLPEVTSGIMESADEKLPSNGERRLTEEKEGRERQEKDARKYADGRRRLSSASGTDQRKITDEKSGSVVKSGKEAMKEMSEVKVAKSKDALEQGKVEIETTVGLPMKSSVAPSGTAVGTPEEPIKTRLFDGSTSDARRREFHHEDLGPGEAYYPFVVMEELLEKMKLLDYEKSYCKELRQPAISRHHFALPTNSGEQFHDFGRLCAWFINTAGHDMEYPHEFDDPNAVIALLLDKIRSYGHTVNFPPGKLKSGCGEHCLWVLSTFADEALKANQFLWRYPIYPDEDDALDLIFNDDAELTLEKADAEVMEELMADDDDIEDDEQLNVEQLKNLGILLAPRPKECCPEAVQENCTDGAAWRLEVERVLPHLKIILSNADKDWRMHLDSLHEYQKILAQRGQGAKHHLERLHDFIHKAMCKITSRETYINRQMEVPLQAFKVVNEELSSHRSTLRIGQEAVTRKAEMMAKLGETMMRVKQDMEERGAQMTDGTPLMNLKKAVMKIKTELMHMNTRVGLSKYVMMHYRMKLKEEQNIAIARSCFEDDDDD